MFFFVLASLHTGLIFDAVPLPLFTAPNDKGCWMNASVEWTFRNTKLIDLNDECIHGKRNIYVNAKEGYSHHSLLPIQKSAVHLNKIYIRQNEVPLFDLNSRLHLFGGIKMNETFLFILWIVEITVAKKDRKTWERNVAGNIWCVLKLSFHVILQSWYREKKVWKNNESDSNLA